MAEPFIGEIRMFGADWAPQGWFLCNGQFLEINSYQALFAVITTTYGGDGVRTFRLPDLRGRVPVHYGSSTDGSGDQFTVGELGGQGSFKFTTSPAQPGDQTGGAVEALTGPTEVTNQQPYLVVNFIIAWQGLFPSRP